MMPAAIIATTVCARFKRRMTEWPFKRKGLCYPASS
jgi:hypothetical protein